MNEDRTGGRTKPVNMPKPLHEQLAEASKEQIAREGGSYLKPRERADVLPEAERTVVASPNDRFNDVPGLGTRGAGDLDAESGLPANYIRGTAGAGDAFCAGVLLGLHENWDLQKCLLTGVCIAAASLADPTCTSGVKSLSTSLALAKKYGFRPRLSPKD